MIKALINGEIVDVDESTLTANHHIEEDEMGRAEVTEWLLDGVSVHRSVNLTLKNGLGIEGVLGRLG